VFAAIPIPNLISGVSQQPPALRLASSCEVMENAWPSVVSGLAKRPPTEFIAKLPFSVTNSAVGYLIDRNNTYKYIVVIVDGDLKVYDLNGAAQTVTFPDGKGYISAATNPLTAFRGLTIGDTTFFLNREVKVTGSSVTESGGTPTRLDPDGRASIYVLNSIANVYYSIYINGVLKGQYLTPKGVDAPTSVPGTEEISKSIAANLTTNGVANSVIGSTIVITGLDASDKVYTSSTQGDKAMRVFRDSIDTFTNLPPNDIEGRIVKVAGDAKDNGDDYYVVYRDGAWRETHGWQGGASLSPATMPHVLVRNGNGTWTFKRHTWNGRFAGDGNSNPYPSFVDTNINDIFLYANRLGFLSDENVILSAANEFETFFRTTVATLVDDDPIDVAALSGNVGVDTLYHSVPFNKDLLLLSDRSQFRLSYSQYLGPKNVALQFTTSFNASPTVHPINMGGSVYFVDDQPTYNYAKVLEYFPKDDAQGDDADDASGSIPQYIKSGVNFMTGSPRLKTLVLNSSAEPNVLYLYKFYWGQQTKLQNSWGKWVLPDTERIYWAGFSYNYLYLLLKRNDGVYIERIKIDEEISVDDDVNRILIDRQADKTKITATYDPDTDETTIILPWETDGDVEVVSTDLDANIENQIVNFRHGTTKVDTDTVTVPGDITGHEDIRVGIPYTFRYKFSTPFMRQVKGQGEVVVLDASRLQMRYLTLEYHNAAYFRTKLSYPGREDAWTTFDGKIIGHPSVLLGSTEFLSGFFRVPLVGNNKEMGLEIINDSPYNASFGSAEWSFVTTMKAQKRF
jgi:hypothetical protein